MSHMYLNYMPYYPSQKYRQFPHYPQSEIWAEQVTKQPLYPHLKHTVLSKIAPFVTYGLNEAKTTSYEHALQEDAAMTYLMGKGMDPKTAYLTVESWEVNEKFY